MSKAKLFYDPIKHETRVVETDSKGKETIADTVSDIEILSDAETIKVFQGYVSGMPKKRRAAMSALTNILRQHLAELDTYQGTGDKTDDTLPNALKEAFRTAETAYFRQFFVEGSPAYDAEFVKKLPTLNLRGDPIAKGKDAKTDLELRFDHFVTETRKESSYSNAKNLFLRFWHFVGAEPWKVDEQTNVVRIEAPEIMRRKIAEVMSLTPPDRSWQNRFLEVSRELYNPSDPQKPTMIDADKLPELIQVAGIVLADLQTRLKNWEGKQAEIAARAAAAEQKTDVKQQTIAAMQAANAPALDSSTAPGEGSALVKSPTE